MKSNQSGNKRCPSGSFAYTIKSGDTLYNLARKYNTTVDAIMKINPGINPNNLKVGQVICIPQAAPPVPSCPDGFLYTIRAGDTIYNLGRKFNVPVQDIINANPGIDPDNLQIGQVICIPDAAPPMPPMPPMPPCPNGFYYIINPGDTLFSISQKFNVPVQNIMNANPGIDPNNLQIGQIICIPRRCAVFCF